MTTMPTMHNMEFHSVMMLTINRELVDILAAEYQLQSQNYHRSLLLGLRLIQVVLFLYFFLNPQNYNVDIFRHMQHMDHNIDNSKIQVHYLILLIAHQFRVCLDLEHWNELDIIILLNTRCVLCFPLFLVQN